MSALEVMNPAVVFLYFVCVIVSGIFTMNPVITLISLAGSVCLWAVSPLRKNARLHLYALLMTLACAVFNPVFGHIGGTVLAVINNHSVTLEAALYGVFLGAMLSAAAYWFSVFSKIMTSDKILYILGFVSQKAALVLTMAMRFIPMYIRKAKQISSVQKTLGLYKDETIVSRVRGAMRVFSVLLTYMIEKTIITSDSMSARGYNGRRRRLFSLYSFGKRDAVFLFVFLILTAVTVFASSKGVFFFNFYPYLDSPAKNTLAVTGYVSYALLCLCPTAAEGGYRIKWHYLRSKISPSPIRSQAE